MGNGQLSDEEFTEKLRKAHIFEHRITRTDLSWNGHLRESRMRAVCERIGASGYAGHPRGLGDLYGAMSRNLSHYVAEDARLMISMFAKGIGVGIAYADELRGWQRDDASVVHYADNSIEVEHVARDGGRKRVTEKSPSGDACF